MLHPTCAKIQLVQLYALASKCGSDSPTHPTHEGASHVKPVRFACMHHPHMCFEDTVGEAGHIAGIAQ